MNSCNISIKQPSHSITSSFHQCIYNIREMMEKPFKNQLTQNYSKQYIAHVGCHYGRWTQQRRRPIIWISSATGSIESFFFFFLLLLCVQLHTALYTGLNVGTYMPKQKLYEQNLFRDILITTCVRKLIYIYTFWGYESFALYKN